MSRKSTDTPEVQQEPDAQEFVYLIAIQMIDRKVYKIGRSNDPSKRLQRLGQSSPLPLIMVHQIASNNAGWLEKALHALFMEKRVKGEWFNLTPADLLILQQTVRMDGPPPKPIDDGLCPQGVSAKYPAGNRPGRRAKWPPPVYSSKGRSFLRIYIDRKPRDIGLGRSGTPEALAKYHEVLKELELAGYRTYLIGEPPTAAM